MRKYVKNILGQKLYYKIVAIFKILSSSKYQDEISNLIIHESHQTVRGPLTYNTDGLASIHNCDFITDPLFKESYDLAWQNGSLDDTHVHWRAHVACWSADKVKNLVGDFVECGVAKGFLSRAIVNYVDFNSLKKKFYLLDTYSGLVEEQITEEEKRLGTKGGGYEESYEEVKRTFADFDVEVIRGQVPDTLNQVKADKVCYLSIDMNCVAPEIAAAEFFWEKITSGGIILLDDYGWPGHIEQKRGFDHFAEQRGVQVLSLPTGQGMIFKP